MDSHVILGAFVIMTFGASSGVAAGSPMQGTRLLPALAELERRAAADSNDASAQILLGRALLEKGRHDEAEQRFRAAVRLAPASAEAYLGLAAVPNARGENYWKRREKEAGRESVVAAWSEAERFYRLAFLLDPLVDPALMPRVEERVIFTPDGLIWWSLPMAKAINVFRTGKYAEAKGKLEKLLKDRSAGPDGAGLPDAALWFHALASAQLRDYQAAATDFTLLLTRATYQAEQQTVEAPLLANDYRYMAAMMLDFAGQADVASLLLREALGTDPSLYMAHSQLARLHEDAERWEEAVIERQRAVDANPENGSLLVDLGLTFSRAGKLDSSLDAFTQAAAMNPRDPNAPYHAAVTALRLERIEVARRYFENFLSIAPSRMKSEISDAHRQLLSIKR